MTVVIISQVYVPDAMAVGQQMVDAAEEMARRGWRVIVYTSNRGCDDPGIRFPSRERRNGVDVHRLPFSSFGKTSIVVRLFAQSLFLAQAVLRSVCVRHLSVAVTTTSPPFGGIAGSFLAMVRRGATSSIWR